MEPQKGLLFYLVFMFFCSLFCRRFFLDYKPVKDIPYFLECQKAVEAEGFTLVELNVVPQKGDVHVSAVIANKDASKDIGVADCSLIHHALLPKLLSLTGKGEDNLYMEVSSPGLERNLKNANEFAFFTGRDVRVWDKTVSDWVRGIIKSADENQVTLEIEGGSEKSVAYVDIAKAKFIHS